MEFDELLEEAWEDYQRELQSDNAIILQLINEEEEDDDRIA